MKPQKPRCDIIEENLESFKNQYSKNSKEVMTLALAIKEITNEVREHRRYSETKETANLKFHEELKPILESYQALIGGRKMFLGAVIVLSAVGSLYLIIKNIIWGK